MKMQKKYFFAIIAIFLISTIAITLPTPVSAAEYSNFAYINATPNPVGVGQIVTVLFFQTIPSPIASAGFNSATNWNGYKVTITSPSGKSTNYGPYTSDATGGAYLTFVPSEVGQYKLDFAFPGQTITRGSQTWVFKATSATTNLTVQQDQLPSYPTPPLPTDYWSQPIYGENRGWDQISGDWLRQNYNNTGPFNPYTTAPNTAHIVWAKNQYMGGVVGGNYGYLNYYQAPTYQSYWVPPILINGRLYYMERQVPGNGWVGLHCVDMRTGQELWFKSASQIGGAGGGGGGVAMNIYGQIFDAEGVNGHGAQAFLWNLGTNWTAFDANSGNQVYTIFGAPTGATTASATGGLTGPNLLIGGVDPVGSIIAYYMNGRTNWLCKWNSTTCLINNGVNAISNLYLPPIGQSLNWTKGLDWNVTIPDRPGEPGFFLGLPASDGNAVFAQTVDISTGADNISLCAYSAADGRELWNTDFNGVFTPGSTSYEFFGPVKDGVMTVYNKNSAQWYGFSTTTGQKLWGPTAPYTNGWDTFENAIAAYGKLFVGTYAGKIYSYDLKTGEPGWTFTLPPGGYETPYGAFPLSGGITVADNKLYAITGEHTPNSPYWLGGAMYCVNATDGSLIYQMSGWWSASPAITNGYALDHNCYDGTIYSFGKGQTSTTVSAPETPITLGQSIVVQGKIMDKSPGRINYAGQQQSTEGSPAIADASMSQWMEYLYQQKTMPANATGVTVSIDVIDANNNFRHVGTTTSDTTGAYSFVWQPDIPGKYTVIASFRRFKLILHLSIRNSSKRSQRSSNHNTTNC